MDYSKNGFALKQRNAPKALARVPEEGQPRGSTIIRRWAVVLSEHASDNVFIDVDAERFVDLLRDPGAAKLSITLLQFNNDTNQIVRGAFWTRLFIFP